MSPEQQTELERGEVLSVGRLAEATGISADTLRIWERRYGKPKPLRLPSGHRRYPLSMVPWLRKVAEGLARGSRPSHLLELSDEQLDALLDRTSGDELPPELHEWIRLVTNSDTDALAKLVEDTAERETVIDFLSKYLAPFMREVGSLWAAGDIEIRHEHLATEVVESVLRKVRARLAARQTATPEVTLLLANLPGEQHGIGLQMVATLCCEFGIHPRILGQNSPLAEIALCAQETRPDAVAIGVSLAQAGVSADRMLAELRGMLPDDLPLVVGGEGSRSGRRGPRGVRVFEAMTDFRKWLMHDLLATRTA